MTNITIIIPSIGRNTLHQSLLSLINQNNPYWKAIVVFDHVNKEATHHLIINDSRITYIYLDKKLGEGWNSAGNVRNIGIEYCNTEWCGFLDDDDALTTDYIETFYKIIHESIETCTLDLDVILFRMLSTDLGCVPSDSRTEIRCNNIGISFCCKTLLLQTDFKFEPSSYEDFTLIKTLEENGKKIMITDSIHYLVRNADMIFHDFVKNNKFDRVYINC